MLREKILPTGIGHTTHCFLQVEGSDSTDEACIFAPDSEISQNINVSVKNLFDLKWLIYFIQYNQNCNNKKKNLNNIGSALSSEKLDSNSLIRVLWPKEKCRLLKEDVVFVDSPGIDVSSDLDSWIDQQCLDADVFVLVVNAEATLTKTVII